jgi:polyisoprenoid-binding protein YceI
VRGNLELHGVTKSIRFPATFQTSPTRATLTARFMLDRQAFGVAYVGAPDNLVRDLVLIDLVIVAKNK